MMNNLQTHLLCQQGQLSGTFRMREPVQGNTKAGRPYLRVRLEDMSGNIYAYSWRDESYLFSFLQDLSTIYVEGRLRYHANKQVVDLKTLYSPRQINRGEVVRLIPQSVCPLPWQLPYLYTAVSKITTEPLVRFVESVFADDSIAFAFVSAPASLNHHHNFPGGLLTHSLESFQCAENYHTCARESFELGLVATLFHDIGKILTLTHEMKRTTLGYCLDHDKLTFEVLGPHLKQLEKTWPDGAEELRYLLTWKVQRPVPRYNMADVVACSDRFSAGRDMEKKRAYC